MVDQPVVATMEQAIGVAHAIAAAEPNVPVGRLLDSIALFLKDRHCPALRRDERSVHKIFNAIGDERAVIVTGWLARRAADWDTFLFWERTQDRYRRRLAAPTEALVS